MVACMDGQILETSACGTSIRFSFFWENMELASLSDKVDKEIEEFLTKIDDQHLAALINSTQQLSDQPQPHERFHVFWAYKQRKRH